MRPPKTFRPSVSDHLETRVVPSQAAVAAVVAPSEGADDDHSSEYDTVRQEFGSFLRGYFRAVSTVLLDRDPTSGRVDPSAHRAAFDDAIGQALEDLASHLQSAESPAADNALLGLREALVGGGGASLRDRLAALPTPTGEQDSTPRMFTQESINVIAETLSEVSDALLRPH